MTALYRNSFLDFIARILSLIGLSFPAFYSAILLILAFSLHWEWFPVISSADMSDPISDCATWFFRPATSIDHGGLCDQGRPVLPCWMSCEDYIRTAKAKDSQAVILFRHALRNALIPIITVIEHIGVLVSNSVLTEIVFNRPGLGKLIIGALNQQEITPCFRDSWSFIV